MMSRTDSETIDILKKKIFLHLHVGDVVLILGLLMDASDKFHTEQKSRSAEGAGDIGMVLMKALHAEGIQPDIIGDFARIVGIELPGDTPEKENEA
jgi:hypothetical protein